MRILFVLAICSCLAGCLVVNTTFDKLPIGTYRGILYLDGRQSERVEPDEIAANYSLEEVARGELPFTFEISYKADSSLLMTLINGSERLEVPNVEFERLMSSARDSVTIRFPLNDSYITAYHEEGVIEGYFVDETRDEGLYKIPFLAQFGVGYRFTDLTKTPTADLSGRWATTFGIQDGEEPYEGIAEFVQSGNRLTGTFLTTTGDYRFLEGTVQENRAYLSVFDGAHAFLFSAKLNDDGTLLGLFRSGNHYQSIWEAKRDENATLPDPEKETVALDPEASVSISGMLPTGQTLEVASLPGRYKVVSLFGSWCPNCKDEALFLDSIRQTVSSTDFSFYGAAFERMADTSRALAAVARFGESLNLGYPLTLVSTTDNKDKATEMLGFLDRVRSFPTLLILDEKNRIVYTHTGFYGPATSQYGAFSKAFAKTLQNLIAK